MNFTMKTITEQLFDLLNRRFLKVIFSICPQIASPIPIMISRMPLPPILYLTESFKIFITLRIFFQFSLPALSDSDGLRFSSFPDYRLLTTDYLFHPSPHPASPAPYCAQPAPYCANPAPYCAQPPPQVSRPQPPDRPLTVHSDPLTVPLRRTGILACLWSAAVYRRFSSRLQRLSGMNRDPLTDFPAS